MNNGILNEISTFDWPVNVSHSEAGIQCANLFSQLFKQKGNQRAREKEKGIVEEKDSTAI